MTETKIQPYPTLLQAIGLFIINLGLLYFFTLVLFSINENRLPQTAIFLTGYFLAMSTTLYLGKIFRANTLGQLPNFLKKIDFKAVTLIILATIALDLGVIMPITEFIPISDFFKESMIQNFGNMDIFMFIALIFGAPFFEEYIYRGVILDGLLKNYAPWLAITISSLLFGALHINPIFLLLKNVGIEEIFEKGFIELSGGIGNTIGAMMVALLIIAISLRQLHTLFKAKV